MKIGAPDLIGLFTHTVSHQMVHYARKEAQRKKVRWYVITPVVQQHGKVYCDIRCGPLK